jgi:succinylglutamate desuccinylase
VQLHSTSQLSDLQLLELITQDYLAFTLKHDLQNRRCHFQLHNKIECRVLGNGIISMMPLTEPEVSDERSSKSIILSCGVHGNETAPIEICNQIIHDLLNNNLAIEHRILFLFGNIAAMHIAERFVEENLNRLFTRSSVSKSQEGPRAVELMDHVDAFFGQAKSDKIHYDLHTAIRPSKNEKFAVYPFLHGKTHSKAQLAFLSACDVNTILLSQSPTATFSYYSSFNHNAHAFTVELGKVYPFGQNDMNRFVSINRKLRELISQEVTLEPMFEQCEMDIYTVNQVINKGSEDFSLHFADSIANFAQFKQGDIFASETGKVYKAEYDGEAIVFPNANVEIGQRAILTVIPHEI